MAEVPGRLGPGGEVDSGVTRRHGGGRAARGGRCGHVRRGDCGRDPGRARIGRSAEVPLEQPVITASRARP